MKKIALIAVCSMGFASFVSAATLAEWSTVRMRGGFASNTTWKASVLVPGMDADKTCLKLNETKFAAAYFPAESFTYRHVNDMALNPDRYIQLILVPEAGKALNLGELVLNVYSTGAGPQNVAVRTDVDNFHTSIKTQLLACGSNNSVFVNLAAFGLVHIKKPLEFRIYLWGAQGMQTGYLTNGRNIGAIKIAGTISD